MPKPSELDSRIQAMAPDWSLATYEVLDTAETVLIAMRDKWKIPADPALVAELTRLIIERRDLNLNRD